MTDEPLIYTSRGNLPISSLTYETEWDANYPHYMKFVERYRTADGEIVKESAHAYSFAGVTGAGVAGQF